MLIAALGATAYTVTGEGVKLNFVRGRYEPGILWSRWNSYSRVAVYPLRSGQAERSWGMSRLYRGEVPDQLGMVVDDTGYSSIVEHHPGEETSWAPSTLFSLPYVIREGAEAFVTKRRPAFKQDS